MKKNNAKKFICLILIASLTAGMLCGCSVKNEDNNENNKRPNRNKTEFNNDETKVEPTEENKESAYDIIKKEDAVLGSIVKFGLYEQDNNLDNGREVIEWRVISVNDKSAMLITEKCIDAIAFDESNSDTWKGSTIRKWLNDTFYNSAFPKGADIILENTLTNSRGGDTNDFVFLLNEKEVKAKLHVGNTTTGASAYCTEYAASKDDYLTADKAVIWWLRSQPAALYNAQTVLGSGKIQTGGNSIWYNHICVRPVIVVKLEQ